MKVIIYESSSKGGCYEYAQYLYRAFIQKGDDVQMILPANSILSSIVSQDANIYKLLLNDQKTTANKMLSKVLFLVRQWYNPIRFLWYLMGQPASVVIWNDFEQLSTPFWIPILKAIARKHDHVIILHDPDRDNYPPSKAYSSFCMKSIIRNMDLALYHEYLPDKEYYKNPKTIFKSIVHGLYDTHSMDSLLYKEITDWKNGSKIISILGNIREEKNYELIMESLQELPHVKLLIAGSPANSSVSIDTLKDLAKQLGVSERIYWATKFLSDSELASCMQASDIVLLYYKSQFTSQSGILNILVPYNKQFIYTDAPSGLQRICKQFEIGVSCIANNRLMLTETIRKASNRTEVSALSYDKYKQAAHWSNIINIIHNTFDRK